MSKKARKGIKRAVIKLLINVMIGTSILYAGPMDFNYSLTEYEEYMWADFEDEIFLEEANAKAAGSLIEGILGLALFAAPFTLMFAAFGGAFSK